MRYESLSTEALTDTHISQYIKVVKKNNITYDQIDSVTFTTLAVLMIFYSIPINIGRNHVKPPIILFPIVWRPVLLLIIKFQRSRSLKKLGRAQEIWEVIDKIKGEAWEENLKRCSPLNSHRKLW